MSKRILRDLLLEADRRAVNNLERMKTPFKAITQEERLKEINEYKRLKDEYNWNLTLTKHYMSLIDKDERD